MRFVRRFSYPRLVREESVSPGARRFLGATPTFGVLAGELVDRMIDCMSQRSYDPGEILIRQGDEGDCLFVIVQGTATAVLCDADKKRHPLADIGRGEVVGEMALLTSEPRTADVVARTPLRVLRLDASTFQDLAYKHPSLGMVITAVVARRLGEKDLDGLGGKLVGGYRIRRRVGRGAMAVVYEAESPDGETVALKMMSHRLIYQEGALERFEREAETLRVLEHRSIARIREIFSAFKTRFIAMEFCDGADLGDSGLHDEAETRRILAQLAAALEYMHRQGVMHRDLKPSNVMLIGDGVIKLTDFGLARATTIDPGSGLTEDHTLVGTPRYMAPEQLAGDPYGEAADVYALGCVALELLTGEPPFDISNFVRLIQSKSEFALPPAIEIGAGISEDMHAFLATALAEDPNERKVDLARVAAWAG